MRKKVEKVIPNENLLGFESEFDLYNKLLEKSDFAFPEYGLMKKKCVCKHLAKLIASRRYSGDELVSSDWARNPQLVKHLKNMARKGFVVYGIVKNKGALKLNMEKIKRDWLNLDHQKTDDELEREAFRRAKIAADEILDMRKKENCFDIVNQLEFLSVKLKSKVLHE